VTISLRVFSSLALPIIPHFSVTNPYTPVYPFTVRTYYDLKLARRQYTEKFHRMISRVNVKLSVRRSTDCLWLH
jgi:hypothetical protein